MIAAERASDADLADLVLALSAYQEVLDRVKIHLSDLGFAPSGRVKTTTTLTEKLRRTRGMQLSRVQDLAGARCVVADLTVQDAARDAITDFYTAQGCPWRVVDRREDPRFGYKAVHIVVQIDGMPVEIQVRTELQDTWAQIVERLADRWGRGIRYGEDPENPEGIVRSGDSVYSRRGAMELLMMLSDAISKVEELRQSVSLEQQKLGSRLLRNEQSKTSYNPEKLAKKIPPDIADSVAKVMKFLSGYVDELDAEGRELVALGTDVTGAQAIRAREILTDIWTRRANARAAGLEGLEDQLRDILGFIASARDEGV